MGPGPANCVPEHSLSLLEHADFLTFSHSHILTPRHPDRHQRTVSSAGDRHCSKIIIGKYSTHSLSKPRQAHKAVLSSPPAQTGSSTWAPSCTSEESPPERVTRAMWPCERERISRKKGKPHNLPTPSFASFCNTTPRVPRRSRPPRRSRSHSESCLVPGSTA